MTRQTRHGANGASKLRALILYRRRRFINHLLTYLLTYLAVLTDFVPLKWHDLARHIGDIAGNCGNKIRARMRLAAFEAALRATS